MSDDQLSIAPDVVPSRTGRPTPVLRVKGELDAVSCAGLRATVDAEVDAATGAATGGPTGRSVVAELDVSPPVVVIDLTEVTFCDSRGLGTLISAVVDARRRGASLRLVSGAGDTVPRLLRRVALEDHLTVHVDVAAALDAVVGSRLEAQVDLA